MIEATTPSLLPIETEAAPARRAPTTLRLARPAAPFIAAAAVGIWTYRPTLFDGKLPGDRADARWTTAVLEHWYRVWTGDEAIRDMQFFQPEARTLGTSDPFFVQGQLHAAARAVGAGLLESWLFAQVATFAIGAIGVAVLARLILRTTWAQLGFVLIACASYPFAIQFGHPQVLVFLWLSWIAVAAHAVWVRTSPGRARAGLAALLVVPPLMAVSGFYGLALGALVGAVFIACCAVLSNGRQVRRAIGWRARAIGRDLLSVPGAIAAVASIALWAFAAWIFLPGRDVLPELDWTEVLPYAPRWSDVFDARQPDGGGIWSGLYADIFEPVSTSNFERQLGFTPVLLVALVVVGLALVRTYVVRPSTAGSVAPARERSLLLAVWATIGVTVLLLVTSEDGFSVYELIWTNVPGFESIRAPFRVQVILFPMAAFVVLRWVERRSIAPPDGALDPSSPRRRWAAAAFGCALAAVMVVEMQRPPDFRWTRRDLLEPDLFASVDEIRSDCDAFVVSEISPSDFMWAREIDAVILATLSGVPTPQGYSRGVPRGHPGVGADADSLVAWMRDQGFDGTVCDVSLSGVEGT